VYGCSLLINKDIGRLQISLYAGTAVCIKMWLLLAMLAFRVLHCLSNLNIIINARTITVIGQSCLLPMVFSKKTVLKGQNLSIDQIYLLCRPKPDAKISMPVRLCVQSNFTCITCMLNHNTRHIKCQKTQIERFCKAENGLQAS